MIIFPWLKICTQFIIIFSRKTDFNVRDGRKVSVVTVFWYFYGDKIYTINIFPKVVYKHIIFTLVDLISTVYDGRKF